MMGGANKPTSNKADVRQRLSLSGIYPTPQRIVIAEVLFAAHQHVTADEVFDRICRNRSEQQVSKATVYNTLGLFVKKGLLREVFLDASRTFFDTNTQPHHHFYNLDTGQLTDIEERLAPFIQEACLPEDTVIQDIDIMIRIRNKQQ